MMDQLEVGRMWDDNADTWTLLSRMGHDVYRDLVNTPAFMAMLPDVRGRRGLDIGCGEGHNTRLLAQRGALMTGIDISEKFIVHACEREIQVPAGIHYQVSSALQLPFDVDTFDFAAAFMSLMDMPEQARAIGEAWRVLRPGGFFQFSICHPCFATPRWKWVHDPAGNKVALECGDYFASRQGWVDEWIFGNLPPELKEGLRPFRVAYFSHTLSYWLNLLVNTGFVLEQFDEPHADQELARDHPEIADTRLIAYFLIIRGRKPLQP
jgi:ubiquinone/menaquinone biosynthesis C-methylase UbiE